MRDQFVPKMQWKVGVGAAQAGDKMVLPRADSAFGGVAPVYVGRDKLKVNLGVGHVLLQDLGAFVVKAL